MSSKKGKRGGKRASVDAGEKKGSSKKQRVVTPTVQEILTDDLTQLGLAYWAPLGVDQKEEAQRRPYEPRIIEDIYNKELRPYKLERIMVLELSHYLENYLWKNYQPKKVSFAHLMSTVIMVNEKFREGVQAWDCFHSREDIFPAFFEEFLDLKTKQQLSIPENTNFIIFLINCFQSLEDPMVRKEVLKLVSLPSWNSLNPERLNKELKAFPKMLKPWNYIKKQEKEKPKDVDHEKTFMPNLLDEYLKILYSIDENNSSRDKIHYCERFVELLLDLISQVPTRRFFHAVMQDKNIAVKSQMSPLASLPEGRLFRQLVDMLRYFDGFEVNDYTGEALSEEDIINRQIEKVRHLQRIAFTKFENELRGLALSNVAALETKEGLLEHLKSLPDSQLRELCVRLALLPQDSKEKESREFMLEIITVAHERRLSQLESISEMPIYPTDEIIWNNSLIPSDEYTGESCLALPKLNLQFLTFYDYLLRNFDLFRLESAYEIRQDIEDAVRRCNPRKDPAKKDAMVWTGWSRMAVPLKEFEITFVGKPKLGEERPSEVKAELKFSIHIYKGAIRDEWDSIKLHDILFLVTCRPTTYVGDPVDTSKPFVEQYGVDYVRGCEVLEILDEDGTPIRDWELEESPRKGDLRTVRVRMDASQYKHDLDQKDEDVNGSFNLLVRRKPKENNFKAVLETIRDLMNTRTVVPEWLHDIFLGYGDPNEAKEETETTLDFVDTFLNTAHAVESFPSRKFKFLSGGTDVGMEKLVPPFKITFPSSQTEPLALESYVPLHRGPYPQDIPKKNAIPFTPRQVEAIRSGMSHGLTLVVGPPGTGKTDVAVQIISNWYHNFPNQRTLLVTHSNQALNQLFEKIMALDIHERHLIRLGHGGEYLETTKDFSKYGRVNYMLGRRLELLAEVDRLSKSLGLSEDVAYTCDTAEHFYLSHVLVAWEQYQQKLKDTKGDVAAISTHFPFSKFFSTAAQPLFHGTSYAEDKEMSDGCWRHLDGIFKELRECRAFELMRSQYDRANYLVTRQARIVAMTCTHAALKRHELVELGFKYDNLLMEEAAQILEIETFIPMLMQEQDAKEACRLKRVVLIGDHHQLPPIIKNIAFQKYAHMDQSLFTRFVRLGVPTVDLDAQGRARPAIAQLYNWRYKSLKDLPNVTSAQEFLQANAGFVHEFQVVNVGDYDGQGEISPNPFFYQNLGEAEYVVAMYMYMRLLGYPAEKISILTTYNGQKHLIRDVLKARTEWNPYYGKPKVSTVDRYQGQQNDYILLSLVRTKTVGHLRDVRRLVVAMSRARLGLYVFCRKGLFENCYELTPTFAHFMQKPDKLQLVQGENYPTTRKIGDAVTPFQVDSVVHMGELVAELQKKFVEQQQQMAKELAAQQEAERIAAEQFAQSAPIAQPFTPSVGSKKENMEIEEEEDSEEEES